MFDELQNNTSTNLQAGFQKSGISPINKWILERRLTSFTEFLKSTREKETVVNLRKKMINVTPGKSVAEERFIEELKEAQSKSTKKKAEKSNQKKKNLYKANDGFKPNEPDQISLMKKKSQQKTKST
ncbi:hypothetical protein ILUMI_21767 [Ignelater luminosus]|uniref:Uncharacterized protein n=1 Tax=Ignelater luminosus TaxID=2038154 RepID=A0A8K0CH17_IGNLU|nr:hypothetical protein ILUMI_21767 [Ignelater luminosus]